MPLTGQELGKIRDALVASFSHVDLTELVLFYFDVDFAAIIAPGPLKKEALDLVIWANHRSIIPDLVRAAFGERPKDTNWQELQKTYGSAPQVSIQHAGVSQPSAPQRATANALEKIVRPRLRMVDMALWRERLAKVETQVCRVEIDGNAAGTGFLVGADLVLTNYHVLEAVVIDRTRAAGVLFRFDYRRLVDGAVNQGRPVSLAMPDWLLASSRYSKAEADSQPDRELPGADELDFVLVRLAQPIGAGPIGSSAAEGAPSRGWIKLPSVQPPLPTGAPIIIAQHPKGDPIQLAMDMDAVLSMNANSTRVRYATNTEPGSSGSPCFDMDWTLVALHHMGDPDWRNPQYNEGVPIGLIAARLAAQGLVSEE